jgi:hypothetical protein
MQGKARLVFGMSMKNILDRSIRKGMSGRSTSSLMALRSVNSSLLLAILLNMFRLAHPWNAESLKFT